MRYVGKENDLRQYELKKWSETTELINFFIDDYQLCEKIVSLFCDKEYLADATLLPENIVVAMSHYLRFLLSNFILPTQTELL